MEERMKLMMTVGSGPEDDRDNCAVRASEVGQAGEGIQQAEVG